MTGRAWKTEAELAALIREKADAGKVVTLSPATATFIALRLVTSAEKPTRNEVALLLCRLKEKCAAPCFECMGRANIIVNVYGQRLD